MFGARTLSSLGIAVTILAALEGQAQDLSVPGTWRVFQPVARLTVEANLYQEYSNKKSLDERIAISQRGIDRIVRELDRNTGEFSGMSIAFLSARRVHNGRCRHWLVAIRECVYSHGAPRCLCEEPEEQRHRRGDVEQGIRALFAL